MSQGQGRLTEVEIAGARAFAQKFEEWTSVTPNWKEMLSDSGYHSGVILAMQEGTCSEIPLLVHSKKARAKPGMVDFQELIFAKTMAKLVHENECLDIKDLRFYEVIQKARDLLSVYGTHLRFFEIGLGLSGVGGTTVKSIFIDQKDRVIREKILSAILRLVQKAAVNQLPTSYAYQQPMATPQNTRVKKDVEIKSKPIAKNETVKDVTAPVQQPPINEDVIVQHVLNTLHSLQSLIRRLGINQLTLAAGDASYLRDEMEQIWNLLGLSKAQNMTSSVGEAVTRSEMQKFLKG